MTGWDVTEQQLMEVAEYSGVLEVGNDFLDAAFRAQCERLLPSTEDIKPDECITAFMFLKQNLPLQE